jgi:flagellar protein FliO/FliZ
MSATPDMLTAGLKMIAALGVVLALILCFLYGLRKVAGHRFKAMGGKRIQVLENHHMGVKKSIALVKVPGKVLVIGLSADRINLLDTLDGEFDETAPSETDSPSFPPLFRNRLKKIGQKVKGRSAS